MTYRLLAASCLVTSLALAPAFTSARADTRVEDPARAEKEAEARAATFGLGAIVGVATYNMLSTAAAASVAGAAGVAGAAAGMVWARNTFNGETTEYRQLIPVSIGGLAGVMAGDYLALGLLGFSPFAAGAGGALPAFGFTVAGVATSMYVYTTGILGARAADAAATRVTAPAAPR